SVSGSGVKKPGSAGGCTGIRSERTGAPRKTSRSARVTVSRWLGPARPRMASSTAKSKAQVPRRRRVGRRPARSTSAWRRAWPDGATAASVTGAGAAGASGGPSMSGAGAAASLPGGGVPAGRVGLAGADVVLRHVRVLEVVDLDARRVVADDVVDERGAGARGEREGVRVERGARREGEDLAEVLGLEDGVRLDEGDEGVEGAGVALG